MSTETEKFLEGHGVRQAVALLHAAVVATDALPDRMLAPENTLSQYRVRYALRELLQGITEGRCKRCLGPDPRCQCDNDD